MTIKLYWNNSHLTRFTARVVDTWVQDENRVVVLDQSAFYPTGGGQPCDTGTIKSMQVVDVETAVNDRICHRLKGNPAVDWGEEVECEVDWHRRREMIQQHTGQHILSQAFFQLFGAETHGFRVADRVSEIDLKLEARPEEIEEAVNRAEGLANNIVFENREIRISEMTPEKALNLPLRKESFITESIRVVEIADYDWSPCGGTHAKYTGEVGLIAVRGWERAKKMTRLRFVCGIRALLDYRAANRTAEAIAQRFSVGRDEAEPAVERMIDENKKLTRRARELSELASEIEAKELIETANQIDGITIISRIFENKDFDELKLIAHRLVDSQSVIALLATRESEMAKLVFARSANLSVDMNSSMKAACEKIGGRGGGKPDFAQGGGTRVSELEEAIKIASSLR